MFHSLKSLHSYDAVNNIYSYIYIYCVPTFCVSFSLFSCFAHRNHTLQPTRILLTFSPLTKSLRETNDHKANNTNPLLLASCIRTVCSPCLEAPLWWLPLWWLRPRLPRMLNPLLPVISLSRLPHTTKRKTKRRNVLEVNAPESPSTLAWNRKSVFRSHTKRSNTPVTMPAIPAASSGGFALILTGTILAAV